METLLWDTNKDTRNDLGDGRHEGQPRPPQPAHTDRNCRHCANGGCTGMCAFEKRPRAPRLTTVSQSRD